MALENKGKFVLPFEVITIHDVNQLIRELETISDFFVDIKAREKTTVLGLPQASRLLNEVVQYNKLNLAKSQDRTWLKLILQSIRTQAPTLHISFSRDPNREFLEKIVALVRREIHPLAIFEVGLQPGIGAGFMLRTNNKLFDFSLKKHLEENRHLFIEELNRKLQT
jgi:F0F1-type ATP synthase delta subunit